MHGLAARPPGGRGAPSWRRGALAPLLRPAVVSPPRSLHLGAGKSSQSLWPRLFPVGGSDEGKYPSPSPVLWLLNFFSHFQGLRRHDPLLSYPTPEKSPGSSSCLRQAGSSRVLLEMRVPAVSAQGRPLLATSGMSGPRGVLLGRSLVRVLAVLGPCDRWGLGDKGG